MNDLTNDGALAPADDSALFSTAVTEGLDDLPDLEPQAPVAPPAPTPPAAEPAIPPARLRQEADARRFAEQRADDLARQLDALRKPPTEAPKRPDVFEDPNAFLDHGVREAVDPIKGEIGQLREFYSRRDAVREHGEDKVRTAFQALDQAANAGDPEAMTTVQRVKKSMDPFGDIVSWHTKQSLFSEVGSDPKAYRERVIEEALKDPEVQKRFLESTRAAAAQTGKTVVRPVVSTLPSLTRVGAAALPDAQDEDDATLFASVTRGKR